jgi:protoporphyrinogen oxidase
MKRFNIIGGGIAGISAAWHLLSLVGCEDEIHIYEKDTQLGGLCRRLSRNTDKGEFYFDIFPHFSFTNDGHVREIFDRGAALLGQNIESDGQFHHFPESWNYCHDGIYARHPLQFNLFPLPETEKIEILEGFKDRVSDLDDSKNNETYQEWLTSRFGQSFTKRYPEKYTRKYWVKDASELEAKWAGPRVEDPDFEKVKEGAQYPNSTNSYYANEMRYPVRGGYSQFLSGMISDLESSANVKINYDFEVTSVNISSLLGANFNKGEGRVPDDHETRVISTVPLPEMGTLLKNKQLLELGRKLDWTSCLAITIGVSGELSDPYDTSQTGNHTPLWLYIYDEDISFARVHYPSRKSADNVPQGCSSIQVEICFDGDKSRKPTESDVDEFEQRVLRELRQIGLLQNEAIIFIDSHYEKYANVTFTPAIYEARDKMRKILGDKYGIITAGRFGEWDYLWSDQALLSGQRGAQKLAVTEGEF